MAWYRGPAVFRRLGDVNNDNENYSHMRSGTSLNYLLSAFDALNNVSLLPCTPLLLVATPLLAST